MDANLQQQIRLEVVNALAESQNSIMTQMKDLITSEMSKMQNQQQKIADTQMSKIESIGDGFKFKRRGNEEQYKHNASVMSKVKEADSILDPRNFNPDSISAAKEKLAEGMSIVQHRQKLIKIADSSELGWRVVQEYESNPLADDSEDEKKLYKAETRAERKMKTEKAKKKRPKPYDVQATKQRRPGRCFGCGEKGHWKKECPELLKGTEKISTLFVRNVDSFDKIKSFDKNCQNIDNTNIISPVNSLKNHLSKWEEIKASDYILRIIREGYRLPLKTIPHSILSDNNKSAKNNSVFVTEEIKKLLQKRCISQVFTQPYIVNPLTVAGNSSKLRLVLDCRYINPHLFQFKFKYEDASTARNMFEQGNYIFSYDLKSAYHHIMVHLADRTYLGFQWQSKFYVFNVLCFGLATAGFIFSKVLREVIRYWRSNSLRILMYLDDGLGGAHTYDECLRVSRLVKKDLLELGFIIAEDKCIWDPIQVLAWLGLVWDLKNGKIRVAQNRIDKLIRYIGALCNILQQQRIVKVKFLASVVGQLISTQAVFGTEVRLRTRYCYDCILDKASWEAPVWVSREAESELRYWLENLNNLNGIGADISQLTFETCDFSLFADASGEGYGGYIVPEVGNVHVGEVYGSWSAQEKHMSSTWRELEAVHRVINSNLSELKGCKVKIHTDNKNVDTILRVSSKKTYLQDINMAVHEVCKNQSISVLSEWIPRESNAEADRLSRVNDCDDWGIQSWLFDLLSQLWGIHTFDRFASSYNRKCDRFNSKFWCKGTSGLDAFKQNWYLENNWLVPPPALIVETVKKVLRDKANATMVIPEWKSAPFWPTVSDGDVFKSFIKYHKVFAGYQVTHRGRGQNGIFGKPFQKFNFVALRIEF